MKKKIYRIFIHTILKKKILRLLPDKEFIILNYLYSRREILKLSNPRTLSEKIQWIKIYGGLDEYSNYVDKYDVRSYISKILGEKYLIPMIGIWNKFDEIPLDRLPKKFVLKATHGSGYVFVCKDKATLDKNELKKIVTQWLMDDYYILAREVQYKNCKPKIICEEYMEEEEGDLKDYKLFCFHGVPQIIQVDSDRFLEHKRDLMDLGWNKLPASLHYPNSRKIIKKPKNFQEIIDVSRRLSKRFPFVRVDLYSIYDKVYFGELTFTPGNGLEKFNPPRIDQQLGEFMDLSGYKK